MASGKVSSPIAVQSLVQQLLDGQTVVSRLTDQEVEELIQSIPDIPGSATMSNREKLTRFIQECQLK